MIAGNHELSFDPEIHKKMTTSTNQNEDHPGPGGPGPGACALGDHGNISNPLSPRMVYGGRGGNDAHSAFSVSRSASSTKILDLKMGKMNLENAQEFIAETEKEFELGNFNAFTDVVADGDNDDQLSAEDMKKELTNCIYLQDASVELYGLKFYGTPWQPEFGGWAFNLPRGQVRFFFRFLEEKKKHIFLLFGKMVAQITQPFIGILYYYSTKVLHIIGEEVGKILFIH